MKIHPRNFKNKNSYTIYFKDGTKFKSTGDVSGIRKSTIAHEMEFIAMHINQSLIRENKTEADIKKIKYNLEYFDHEPL